MVSPETATIAAGGNYQLDAIVSGGTTEAVTWTSGTPATATVGATGLVTVAEDALTGATVIITATSTENPLISGTATITVE